MTRRRDMPGGHLSQPRRKLRYVDIVDVDFVERVIRNE
jgi:hypothetical protein